MNKTTLAMTDRALEIGGAPLALKLEMLLGSKHPIPIPPHIALKYRGIGKVAVHQLIEIGAVSPFEGEPGHSLSTRAYHCLSHLNLLDKYKARAAITSGALHPKNRWDQQKSGKLYARNYGWKTHKEVCMWVGLPEEAFLRSYTVIQCPHCRKEFPWSKMSKRRVQSNDSQP